MTRIPFASLQRHAFIAVSIFAAVAIASVFMTEKSLTFEISKSRFEVETQAQRMAERIENEIGNLSVIARSVSAVLAGNGDMDPEAYARIVARISADNALADDRIEILNIAAAPDLVVRYVYPQDGNAQVLGLDYRDLPEQYPSVLAAMARRQPIITGPVTLKQGGQGLIVRVAVNDLITGEPWGVVSVVAGIDAAFTGIADMARQGGIAFSLTRTGEGDAKTVFGDTDLQGADAVRLPVQILDQSWLLSAVPQGGWPTHASDRLTIWSLFAVLGGSVFVIYLILDRLQTARRAAEDRLQDAINAIDDGFAIYDADDRFLTSNQTYKDFYARSAEKMTPGTPFAEIIRFGVDRGEYRDAVGREDEWYEERMTRHRHLEGASIQRIADGRWLKVSEKRLADGATVGFRVDITELMEARQAAEAANHAKTLFLDQMSHELRTPLAVLLGYVAFLENPNSLGTYPALKSVADRQALYDFVEDIAKTSGRVSASGRRLLGLVDRILDISNIDGDLPVAEPSSIGLNTVLTPTEKSGHAEVLRQAARQADADGILVHANAYVLNRAVQSVLRHAQEAYHASSLDVEITEGADFVSVHMVISGDAKPMSLRTDLFSDRLIGSDVADSTVHEAQGIDIVIAERLAQQGGAVFCHQRLETEADAYEFRIPRVHTEKRNWNAA